MFALGERRLREDTMLGARLRHATLQRGNEMALFSVIPEARVKNICVIFCYKVPRYIYLWDSSLCQEKTQGVRCQAWAECLAMEANWPLVIVAEGLPSLGKRLPIVASKRDSMGLDFEIVLDE